MVEFFNPVLEVLIYYILSVKTISNLLIKFKLTGKIPLQTGNLWCTGWQMGDVRGTRNSK